MGGAYVGGASGLGRITTSGGGGGGGILLNISFIAGW